MKSIKLILIVVSFFASQFYAQDNWTDFNVHDPGITTTINSITFFNADTGIVVGAGETIFRTVNGGKNWTLIEGDTGTTSTAFSPNEILIKNYNSSISNYKLTAVLVGDDGTIKRSVDLGLSWTNIPSGTSLNINGITKETIDSFFDITYAVGDNGLILKSSDDGLTWTQQASGTTEKLNSVSFFNADTGIAVGNNETILRTTDGGVGWTRISGGSAANAFSPNEILAEDYNSSRSNTSTSIAVVVGSGGTILRSTDFGLTWSPVSSGVSTSLLCLAFKDSSLTAVGDNGTILVSSDFGLSWQSETSRTTAQLRAVEIAMKEEGVNRYIGGSGGALLKAAASQLNIISPGSSDILCTNSSQTITWTGGNTGWNVLISLIDVNAWTVYLVINASTPNDGDYLWNIPSSIPSGLYQINIQEVNQLDWKYSATFTIENQCTSCIPPPDSMVAWWPLDETSGTTAVDIAGVPNNGTHFGGPVPVSGKVAGALSFDSVDDYVEVADHPELNFGTGDFSIDAWVLTNDSVAVATIADKRSGTNANPLGYSLYLFNGKLGLQLADNSGFNNYNSSAFVADGQWHHIAVTVDRNDTSGLKFYVDGNLVDTSDPTPYNGSLTNTGVFRIASHSYDQDTNFMFEGVVDELELFNRALTAGEVNSIWAADSLGKCKTVTDIQENESLPENFELMQSYPNPFNPTSTIRFKIAESGFTTLKVYDVLGRVVVTLVNEVLTPGIYERTFDAKGLASGVYFYRIQTEAFVQTRKMLLLK